MFSLTGEKQKKKPPIIKRFAPVLSKDIDLSPSAAPVLEAYIDDSDSHSSRGSKKTVAPKSKLYEPTKFTPITFDLQPHVEFQSNFRKNPPGETINDLEMPIISISKSQPIYPNSTNKLKLHDLIKAAPDGATLFIPDGVYEETIILKKRINLISNGKAELKNPNGKNLSTIIIKSPNVSITGFAISNTESNAVFVEYGSVLIENCKLISNSSPAVSINPEMFAIITNCDITSKSNGIFCNNGIIESQNTAIHDTADDAILLSGSSVAKFTNCQIFNGGKNGFASKDTSRFILDACKIQSCAKNGIDISAACLCSIIIQSSITECGESCITASNLSTPKIIGCNLSDSYGPTVILSDGVGCTMRHNTIERCKGASSILVQSNASLFSSGDKFSHAGTIAVILCENVIGEFNRCSFSQIKGTGISISNAAKCEINDCSFSSISKSAIISNLSQANSLKISNTKFKECQVGLAFTGSKLMSTVYVTNASFERCRLSGVQIINAAGEIKFEKCQMKKNHECGILLHESSNVAFYDTEITGSSYSGIESYKSNIVFIGGKINQNSMGGICLRSKSSLQIKNVELLKNGVVGLSLESKSSATTDGCHFNTTSGYACSVVRQSSLAVNNTTIEHHKDVAIQIEGRGSKLYFDGSSLCDNGIGLVVADAAQCIIKNTEFDKNDLHVEARDNASVKAQFAKFTRAKGPVSVHSITGSSLHMQSCSINENNGAGLACSSSASIITSAFISNAACGVVLYSPNTNLEIDGGSIEKNGEVGVCVYDGMLKMQRSVVQDHQCCGIVVSQKAKTIINEIQFSNNGLMNINRE